MATVTRKFRDDFELWANARIESGDWTREEIEELKAMLRIDFSPGPDQLRAGLTVISAAGVEVPAMIDDHEERYRLWSEFFSAKAARTRGFS